jgi:Tfp pilus assembly protein PilO
MANWTQKKLILTIAGSAVALCLVAGGGVYYATGLIEEVEAEITTKREAIAAAERKIAQIPTVEKEVIILRENLDEYVKILPDSKELVAFVRMLDQFERQSGIRGTGLVQKNQRTGKTTSRFTPIEYTYEMTATLWECLKFMNLVENYERFVNITDFSIQAGGNPGRGDDLREGDVVHTVRLTMVTYTYNGNGEGKDVVIPDYPSKRDALREEIWKRTQAIRVDRYEHPGVQGRRDIFVDPRERGDVRLDGPSPAEQRKVLERYIGEVSVLLETMRRSKQADITLFEQYSLEKSLRAGLDKALAEMEVDGGRISYAPYKLRWAKEVVGPLESLRQQVTSVTPQPQKVDPFLPLREMQQLVADLAADCNNGLLEQARDRYQSVAERLVVPADDPRHELAVQAKSWHVKASTAIDFKGMDLRVQGVVVNRGGRSGVLLNGEVFEEGDYVAEDLLVKMVEEDQVWFVFRGLTLVRTM